MFAAISFLVAAENFFLPFFSALTGAFSPLSLAHLAFAAAEIAALPAALMVLFFLPFFGAGASVAVSPLILAHLSYCAFRILALAAALNLRFLGCSGASANGSAAPRISVSSSCSSRIRS